MKEIVKLGLILFIIGTVAAALLAVTYDQTIDQILEQRKIADEIARKAVFPAADGFTPASEEELAAAKGLNAAIAEIYFAESGGETVGYVVKTKPSGFGGTLDVVTGVDLDGTITGLRVGNHQETPGLGANATLPAFYTQFEGLSILSSVEVNKTAASGNEIQAITGATITSKAVTSGVNVIGDIFDTLGE